MENGMTTQVDFQAWFTNATGHAEPRDWQLSLGMEAVCRNRLLHIPTGLGKTDGVLAAWLYHRVGRDDDRWPRRLVWCLPMRVLVEQTEQVARTIVEHISEETRPDVYVAMGGKDAGEWFLHPEKPSILIGTQDMLLSRALNRGYASGRARWPMEYALLNQDCLWVMDEVQLMDVGLATSAQLQAFRDQDRSKQLRPCHTWWMSATLQAEWLRSVDTAETYDEWIKAPCVVPPEARRGDLWEISKSVTADAIDADDSAAFDSRIRSKQDALEETEFGRIALLVCNTVECVCATYLVSIWLAGERRVQRHPERLRVPLQREDRRIAGLVIFQPRQNGPPQSRPLFDVCQRQPELFPFSSQPRNRLINFPARRQPSSFPGVPFAKNLVAPRLNFPACFSNLLRFSFSEWADYAFGFLSHRLRMQLLAGLRFCQDRCTRTHTPNICPRLSARTRWDGPMTGCAEQFSRSARPLQTRPASPRAGRCTRSTRRSKRTRRAALFSHKC